MRMVTVILILLLGATDYPLAREIDSLVHTTPLLPMRQMKVEEGNTSRNVRYYKRSEIAELTNLLPPAGSVASDPEDFAYNNDFLTNFPFLKAESLAMQRKLKDFVAGKMGEVGNLLLDLTGITEVIFPAGMQYETPGGLSVSLIIESISFDRSNATLHNLLLGVEAVGSPMLVFGAPSITFSRTGGFQSAILGLIGDVPIPINGSNETMLILRGYDAARGEGCYATIGCDGLESVEMKVSTFISRNLLVPVDEDGVELDGFVYGDVKVQGSSLDNISGGIDISRPFKINGLDQLIFYVEEAWYDGDEIDTPEAIYFPDGYFDEKDFDLNRRQWKGLSLGRIGIKLVDFFGQETEEDPGVEFRNILIDRFGVTGEASLIDPLPLEKGKVGSARISLEELSVSLYKSALAGVSARGKLTVPGLGGDEDGGIGYVACVQKDGWHAEASLEPGEELPFPLLKDALVLTGGTSLSIGRSVENNETVVQVNLCGKISLGSVWPANDPGSSGGNISIQNFRLQSTSPMIQSIGYWDIPHSYSFPAGPMLFTLSNVVTGMTEEQKPRLYFQGEAAFSGNGGFNISGAVGVSIYGDYGQDGRLMYDRTEVDKVGLCVSTGAFAATVELHWFDDMPGYGSGFKGKAGVALRAMGYEPDQGCDFTTGIRAMALFGNVNDTRYYNFELLYINTEDPIPLGPMGIYGLGGSISNRMISSGIDAIDFEEVNFSEIERTEDEQKADFLGKSILGLHYEPDVNAGLSLKFMGIMATQGSSSLANMSALMSFEMNSDGGLDSIYLDVEGQMFEDISLGKIKMEDVPIYFKARVVYDNVNRDFLLAATVDIETDAGMRGGGKLIMEAGPPGWYIHIGYPGEVKNIGLVLPIMGLEANAYFCAGNYNVPDMPLLPIQIRNIFSGASNHRTFDVSDEFGGMAFGSHLDLGSPKEKSFLFFYYKLHILLGLDINIRNYKGYACGGDPTFGVNQWYAKGQVYAYVDGAVGLQAAGKKFPILELTTAFKIYLETPAPTYGEFGLMVKYRVLGGLVKGRAKIEASFGSHCDLSKQSLELNLFDELIYPENQQHASITDDITFSGGVPFFQPFPDDVGDALFRVEVADARSPTTGDSYSKGFAYYELNGQIQTITCQKSYSSDRTIVTYSPEEHWPPNARVWIEPRAKFQQSSKGRLNWQSVKDQSGHTQRDTLYAFTTGDYPSFIPSNNVEQTYPADGMSNYYADELDGKCFIKLKKGMEFLFLEGEASVRLINHSNGVEKIFDCAYLNNEKTLEWLMPSAMLDPSVLYSLYFEKRGQEIYSPIHFRTSKFRTLREKLGSVFQTSTVEQPFLQTIEISNTSEPFDEWELFGDGIKDPLLDLRYDLDPLYATYPSAVEPQLDAINASNYLFVRNEFTDSNSSHEDIPKITVQASDQLGDRPRYSVPGTISQSIISDVHRRFVTMKASEILKDGYDGIYLNDLKERYGESTSEGAVEAWRLSFLLPEKMVFYWTYKVGKHISKEATTFRIINR